MKRNIENRDLNLVRIVSETGSLTAAARRLHLSQPAISQRLGKIQRQFDAALFERRDSQMRPTPIADRLVDASRRINIEYESAMSDIDILLAEKQQRLRITTQCYTCYRWLPFVIRDMHLQYPSVTIDVVPGATDTPHDALANDRVDVAIVFDTIADNSIAEEDLFADELFAVMSSAHPLSQRKFLNPRQFAGEALVLYSGDRHPILDAVLHPAGISPGKVIEVRITEAIVELARSGQGIAVLAGWAFRDLDDRSGLTAVRITRGGFKRTWRAAISRRCAQDHAQAFVQCVRGIGETIRNESWREQLRQTI